MKRQRDKFPPEERYVSGIPCGAYEFIRCNLQAHLYMYRLVISGTYNWRARSSLIGESFFSQLSNADTARSGVLPIYAVGQHFGKVSEMHALVLDPNR